MSKQSKEKIFLSASKMGTLDKCSWQYWCKYVLGLPDKTNDGAIRGSICHLILELLLKPRHKKYYDTILETQDIAFTPAVDRTVIKHLKQHDAYNEENYDLCNKMIYVGLDNEFFGGEDGYIEAPEKQFTIESKKPKYNIRGYIDKPVEYDKEKLLKIVDYKTSKKKFRGDELESNIQAMMYSLAAKKLWPKMKRRIVQFLFLKFPRSPKQELEFTDEQLKGFEYHLEQVNQTLAGFNEEDAKSNYAADNGTQWLCGPAKSGWICPFHRPSDYFVLLDNQGRQLKSSYEEDLSPSEDQTVEKRSYAGCPRKCGETQESFGDQADDFEDLGSSSLDDFDF
jgi:ATP-dependent helicase/DNAse subunit B